MSKLVQMLAQHRGRCESCEERVYVDDPIFWDPEHRVVYCESCGSIEAEDPERR